MSPTPDRVRPDAHPRRCALGPDHGFVALNAVRTAAQTLRVNLEVFEARHIADIADVFYALNLSHTHGVLILSSPLFGGNPQVVADLAMRKRIPTISLFPDTARRGGLLAYGPDIQGLYRQAGGMARKALHGAKPRIYQQNDRRDSSSW